MKFEIQIVLNSHGVEIFFCLTFMCLTNENPTRQSEHKPALINGYN